MERLQALEFEYRTTKLDTLLKRIEKKNPQFFEIWGEVVEYLFNLPGDYNVMDESKEMTGYCIGIDKQEDLTYVWFIATDVGQVIK